LYISCGLSAVKINEELLYINYYTKYTAQLSL